MKSTTNPARAPTRSRGWPREFNAFTKIFADIMKVKSESALVAQNQLTRGGTMLRYKLNDLAQQLPRCLNCRPLELGAERVKDPMSGDDRARQYLRDQRRRSRPPSPTALARIKFVENSMKAISTHRRADRRTASPKTPADPDH